ncbi:MAG: hypothetical protein Q7R35_03950 [Elusimicrobiota bacterium]|nr:hypothetical protein [Elusimicrobiota bacterium]
MKDFNPALEKSVSYLASPEALRSLERDPYWPKWIRPGGTCCACPPLTRQWNEIKQMSAAVN